MAKNPIPNDPKPMISTVHARGRVQIPHELRKKWNVGDGDIIVWDPMDHEAKVYPGKVVKKET